MPLDVVVGWDEVNGKTVTFHPKSEDPFPRPPLAPPHLAIASPPFSSSPCLASPEHPRPRQRPGPSTLPPPLLHGAPAPPPHPAPLRQPRRLRRPRPRPAAAAGGGGSGHGECSYHPSPPVLSGGRARA